MDIDAKVRAFNNALARHPHAVSELKRSTYVRYVQGEFPAVVQWLMRYPSLLRALAEDAEAAQARNPPLGRAKPRPIMNNALKDTLSNLSQTDVNLVLIAPDGQVWSSILPLAALRALQAIAAEETRKVNEPQPGDAVALDVRITPADWASAVIQTAMEEYA